MRTSRDAAYALLQGVRPSRSSPVIVATDGHDQSNAAMMMARILAPEKDARRVVSVLKMLPAVTPELPVTVTDEVEASRRREQTRMVRQQAKSVWADDDVQSHHGRLTATVWSSRARRSASVSASASSA